MNKKVSIITPNYNSEKFIEDSINSVISQTYDNWEMIIVDDCSSDNSQHKILSLANKDSRIKPILLKSNVGAAEARNIALRKAKGNYIAFLDSDDLWNNEKLEKQINFMINNRVAFSFTSYNVISESGKKISTVIKVPSKISYSSYLKNTIIGCLTVIINRDMTGDFQFPKIKSSHDMALWLQIMKRGFLAYGLDHAYASYRIVSNSNTANKLSAALDVWKVYRDIEGLSFFYSSFCFIHYVFNAIKKRI